LAISRGGRAPGLEFELLGSPRFRRLILVLYCTAVTLITIGWSIISGIDVTTIIWALVGIAVFSGSFALWIQIIGTGWVTLKADGIVVETFQLRQKYAWEHVSDVRLEGSSGHPSSSDIEPATVKVELSRSKRLSLIPGRGGTDTFGIPSLVLKTLRLQVNDPEGLVAAAHSFLRR